MQNEQPKKIKASPKSPWNELPTELKQQISLFSDDFTNMTVLRNVDKSWEAAFTEEHYKILFERDVNNCSFPESELSRSEQLEDYETKFATRTIQIHLVTTLWNKLDELLKEKVPEVYQTLAPGASEQEIKEAEAKLNVTFPPDIKQFMRMHNGQIDETGNYWYSTKGFFGSMQLFLPLSMWTVFEHGEEDVEDQEQFYNSSGSDFWPWIRIGTASDSSYQDTFLDFDYFAPTVRMLQATTNDCDWNLVAVDVVAFLQEYVDALRSDRFEKPGGEWQECFKIK